VPTAPCNYLRASNAEVQVSLPHFCVDKCMHGGIYPIGARLSVLMDGLTQVSLKVS